MAKISDAFPVLDVSIVLNGDISQISTDELVKDKNVVLVGVLVGLACGCWCWAGFVFFLLLG